MSLAALGAVAAALAAGPPPAAVVEPSPAAPIVVAGHPISRGALRHWAEIAARLGGGGPRVERRAAAALLISVRWIRGEAAERGVVVRRGEVTRELRKQRKAAFPRRRDYRRYLRESGRTRIDIRSSVKTELLTDRLRALAIEGATTSDEQQAKLEAWVAEFSGKWRARTTCRRPWVSKPDCGRVSQRSRRP